MNQIAKFLWELVRDRDGVSKAIGLPLLQSPGEFLNWNETPADDPKDG